MDGKVWPSVNWMVQVTMELVQELPKSSLEGYPSSSVFVPQQPENERDWVLEGFPVA